MVRKIFSIFLVVFLLNALCFVGYSRGKTSGLQPSVWKELKKVHILRDGFFASRLFGLPLVFPGLFYLFYMEFPFFSTRIIHQLIKFAIGYRIRKMMKDISLKKRYKNLF